MYAANIGGTTYCTGVQAVARKARAKKNEAAPAPPGPEAPQGGTTIAARVVVESDDASAFYINFAEISHSRHEFMMHCVQAPTKLSPTMREVVISSGEVRLSPMVTLLMPPTLIPGLIRALTVEMEKYEQQNGPIRKDHEEDEEGH